MTRVLVPLAVLEGETVSPGLIDLLGTTDVTVLGYHVLPEQTPPDQARLQYEDRATAALEDVSAEFRAAGGGADHRLVFTHDREQTRQRVAADVGADAFAITGTTGSVERLLVSVTGEVDVDRILPFVVALVGDRPIGVTLFAAAEASDAEGGGETARAKLDDAAARLRDAGVDVETDLATGGPFEALVAAAAGHDAVVVGERAPSLRSFLLGDEGERVATETVGPVLVVRRTDATDDGQEVGAGRPETDAGDDPDA
jgi:nucleotide-binding universal stress UspA family protein